MFREYPLFIKVAISIAGIAAFICALLSLATR